MKDKLNTILQKWATGKERSKEDLRLLAMRISAEASRQRLLASEEIRSAQMSFRAKFAYAASLAAAVIFLFYFIRYMPSPTGGSADDFASVPVGITGKQMEGGWKLFGEMERMFTDQLRWVAQSNGDVDLGVEPIPGGPAKDSAPMQYRLTVVSRKSGEKAWRPAWSMDVLLHREELVEIAPGCHDKNKLDLWVYPLADGKVAVDTGLSLDTPMRVASRTSSLMDLGKPAEVLEMRSGDVEYRVFQTVVLLGKAS